MARNHEDDLFRAGMIVARMTLAAGQVDDAAGKGFGAAQSKPKLSTSSG
jgi:hypothetical protein